MQSQICKNTLITSFQPYNKSALCLDGFWKKIDTKNLCNMQMKVWSVREGRKGSVNVSLGT